MIEVTDIKKGVCFLYKGQPVMVVSVGFSTPTARGGATIAKARMRNLLNGQLLSDSFRSGDKLEEVDTQRRPVSYLYSDGERFHFMDAETYEQFELSAEEMGDAVIAAL